MLIALIVIAANLITAFRLMCYRRGCARYRPGVSFLAYVLIVCAGGQVIDIMVNLNLPSIWAGGQSVVIAALVWRSKGNLAALTRAIS